MNTHFKVLNGDTEWICKIANFMKNTYKNVNKKFLKDFQQALEPLAKRKRLTFL